MRNVVSFSPCLPPSELNANPINRVLQGKLECYKVMLNLYFFFSVGDKLSWWLCVYVCVCVSKCAACDTLPSLPVWLAVVLLFISQQTHTHTQKNNTTEKNSPLLLNHSLQKKKKKKSKAHSRISKATFASSLRKLNVRGDKSHTGFSPRFGLLKGIYVPSLLVRTLCYQNLIYVLLLFCERQTRNYAKWAWHMMV